MPEQDLFSTLLPADSDGRFARDSNRESFVFEHGLADHPLLSIEALTGLAERLSRQGDAAYWSNGAVQVGDPWEKGMFKRQTLPETVRDIAGNDSIAILRRADQDPAYGPLLRRVLAHCLERAGDRFRSDVIRGEAQILIASPGRITPYHFDRELNYLFQVRGDKLLRVFDATRGAQVAPTELEAFFAGHPSAAVHDPAREPGATLYRFRAGQGVHIPCFAPHWVQNGHAVSVAISFCYELHSVARFGQVCWMNHQLRRLGIDPSPAAPDTARNRLKRRSAVGLQRLRRYLRRLPSPAAPSGWTPDGSPGCG